MKPTSTNTVSEIEVSYRPAIGSKPVITSTLDSFTELIGFFPSATIALQEYFVVMYLNRGSRVLGIYPISKGGLTGTVADLRLILSVALKIAATGIIIAHNHPSGSLLPSQQDLALTLKIQEACKLMDITLCDHIIISPERKYLSFAEEGLL